MQGSPQVYWHGILKRVAGFSSQEGLQGKPELCGSLIFILLVAQ